MLPALKAEPIDPAEAIDPMAPTDPAENADPRQWTDPIEKALPCEATLKIEFFDQSDQLPEEQVLAICPVCRAVAGPASGPRRFLGGARPRVT